jgi:shikimate-5-dehydrogenase/3-dehydroquinate dehydratase type I
MSWILATLLLFPSLVASFSLPAFVHRAPRPTHFVMLAASPIAQEYEGNMFQAESYTKPIVLLGSGSELSRLADSFVKQTASTVVTPKDDDSVVADVESERLKYPNVIVLDFEDETVQEEYTNVAKSLYDAGLLSIYVNVQDAKQKEKLEESVFVKYSDYELCIRDEGSKDADHEDWLHIEWELSRLVARAMLVPAMPGDKERTVNTAHLTMGANTFFLSLSFPDITQVEPFVGEMCRDVDAMEYRCDLLECRDSRFDLIYGQQLLRKYCRPHVVRVPGLPFGGQVLDEVMPIVYTVRTQNQAGTYPDDEEGIDRMFEMLEWGLRSGAEVVDVESAWDKPKTDALLALAKERYSSQILGSHHVVGKEISLEDAVELFEQCAMNGRAHGAKVVLSIEDEEKDSMAYEAALIASSLAASEGEPVIPNISLILGDVGQFSRVLNIPFTPVTHESLPVKAAPGQMTANEIMTTRLLTKILGRKRYAILGHNIAYSVSPQMQGTAFAAVRLPHNYFRADVETVEEFVESEFFKADDFGGCSVTIPHKKSIIPYVDVMSDAAKAIGSVNTLVVKEEVGAEEFERRIYGDNTDWRGIFNPLERQLGQVKSKDCALILGAGGTARAAAYAAEKLGLDRIYFNRTPAKAKELAETFGGTVVKSLDEKGEGSLGALTADGPTVRVVISTLPAAADFELPEWIVESKPIVFDVNYKPYFTKLLIQAEASDCPVVRGSEMLWEQGVGQFELWTERTAPYKVMKTVVLENCLPKEDGEDDVPAEQPDDSFLSEAATKAWQ